MKSRLNVDILGGISLLAIAVFFLLQMNEDFSMFGLYFPEKILPLLIIIGIVILIKGFVRPAKTTVPLFIINKTMLAAMLVGLLWVMFLELLGFVLTSFFGIFCLQMLYTPASERSIKSLTVNIMGTLVIVLMFRFIFVQYLGVTLPSGTWLK